MSHEEQIRGAMERLLRGASLHTDGALNVANLAREGGLSRQQLYRSGLVDEFKAHVERLEAEGTGPVDGRQRRLVELQDEVAQLKERNRQQRQELAERDETIASLRNLVLVKDTLLRQGEGKMHVEGRVIPLPRRRQG